MNVSLDADFFTLMGLPQSYAIDTARLDSAYRELQARVHPDRFVSGTDAEKRLAMQWATHANEAYRTLRRPLDRARYLLKLRGVDTGEQDNTAMPAEFLMQQMEWREAVADVANAAQLDALVATFAAERRRLFAELADALTDVSRSAEAALAVRKLRFIEKLEQEADAEREAAS